MSSFDEDMKDMRRQVTAEVIYTINSSPRLYTMMKDLSGKEVKHKVYAETEENDGEFGPVFEAELDALNRNDWAKVASMV